MHISFETTSTEKIFLDYCGDEILSLVVNSQEVPVNDQIWHDGHIYLPSDHLVAERNIVEIRFANKYYTDGNGIHTYTDIDGSQYLYIQSEPYWNNRVLPLFDQPDIKGYFSLTSLIPEQWVLITSEDPKMTQTWDSNTQPINGIFQDKYFKLYKDYKAEDQGNLKLVTYKKSKLLPTYLFFFACGPYTFFELPEEQRYNNIPMKLYCRESMKPFLEK